MRVPATAFVSVSSSLLAHQHRHPLSGRAASSCCYCRRFLSPASPGGSTAFWKGGARSGRSFVLASSGGGSGDDDDDSSDDKNAVSHSSTTSSSPKKNRKKKKVAIVGGGLAGLATAYHLLVLHQQERRTGSGAASGECGLELTVFDRGPVGTKGASSVAGGLVHPLSPRGKLVHWGLEGLAECNKLIDEACKHYCRYCDNSAGGGDEKDCAENIVMRDELYRLAMTDQQAMQLQKTAALETLPDGTAQWLSADEVGSICPYSSSSSAAAIVGGLRLSGGCKVIHVPSYLKGLWGACLMRAEEGNSTLTWAVTDGGSEPEWKGRLQGFDAVVLSAGAGLFGPSSGNDRLCEAGSFPIQLVGGQSVELSLSDTETLPTSGDFRQQAFLCGKYVSPLPSDGMVLVGATHEFSSVFISEEMVVEDLKERTYGIVPDVWDRGTVSRVTRGVRVQSERGKYGRRPIIGRLPQPDEASPIHPNAWIFTGLSSRGLLYHGLYGGLLADAILCDSEEVLLERCQDVLWWRR